MNYILEVKAFYDWLEVNQLSTSAIALWHALMHIANKTGWQDTFTVATVVLETKTSLKKQAIINARVVLQNKGLINFKSRGGNQSAIYKINPFVSIKQTQTDTQGDTQTNTQINTQEDTQTHTINKQNKTKLNKTNKKKDTKEKKFVDDDNLNNTILDFIEFRKNIKSPMTDKAVKLLLNRLNTLAPNDTKKQVSILEQSIMQGWKSVYPLKEDEKENKGGSSYGTSIGSGIEDASGVQTDWDIEVQRRKREGKLKVDSKQCSF